MSTWVLLRGLTREQAHWGGFVDQLAQALPKERIVALDLPGAGSLYRQRSPARVEAIAESCRQRLNELSLPAPYVLLGLSLGGMVAAAWAARWPNELRGCVLVNTSLRPFSPWQQRLRWAQLPGLLRLLLLDARRAEQAILHLTSSTPARHSAVIDDWVAIRRARPVSPANALRQLLAAARYRAAAHSPGVPLLVVHSAADALVDPRCSRALAVAWGAELLSHPSAGHDLPLDDGLWLAQQLALWRGRALAP